MRRVSELLEELRKSDVRLWREGDQLRASAPPTALSAALRSEIAARKSEILAYLDNGATQAPGHDGIPPISRDGPLPLSFVQERLWFIQQLDPGGSANNVTVSVRTRGPLDVDCLERCLSELVRRHEVLRSRFVTEGGQPTSVIDPPSPVRLPRVDLTHLDGVEAEARVADLLDAEARCPFDLERGPVFRPLLFCLPDQEHRLVITQHHLITDRWSLGLLTRELRALYQSFHEGRESPLEEPRLQYVDFAAWQRDEARRTEIDAQLEYWLDQLKPPLPGLDLPTDRPRPPLQDTTAATVDRVLPKTVHHAVAELAVAEGCSPFMVLLSTFVLLLGRYARQEDVLVGTPVAGRMVEELEPMMGCFINTLVLRTDLSGEPTFRELLSRVRSVVLGALAHQGLPFERLVEAVDPPRDPSRSPLVQVTCAHQTLPHNVEAIDGLDVASAGSSVYDLSLYFVEVEDGLHLTVEYSTALFEEATARRFAERYEVLLARALANPDREIHRLSLCTDEDHGQIEAWNATDQAVEPDVTVCGLVARQAVERPHHVAVRYGAESLTYAELLDRVGAIAQELTGLGAGPGSTVAVALDRSVDLVAGLLGTASAGACYLPLDPNHPPTRIQAMCRDAGAGVVLTTQDKRDLFEGVGAKVLSVEGIQAPTQALPSPSPEPGPEDLAYVIYTSGSTGRPKGVEVRHASLTNLLRSMARDPGMSADDVLLSVTTPSFDIAALELFLPLCVGGTLVVAPTAVVRDGRALSELLSSCGATIMQATPATWRLMTEAGWEGNPDLRILCGGEALSADLARDLQSRGAGVWNLYGPTETTIWSTFHRIVGGEAVPIGGPIDNTDVYILNDRLEMEPFGVSGEICIGGAGLAVGYRGQPELTRERFVSAALPRGQRRLYRTGDLGRVAPDGTLEYHGRIDQQIKIRGFRVEPAEIEELLRSHEAIADAAAAVRNQRLVAFVVFEPGADLTGTEVRRFVATGLPEYMVPSLVAPVPELPQTLNGKLDRAALPDPFVDRARHDGPPAPPATESERLIASVWTTLLEVDEVSAHDNFYEIGGHSLLSMRVVHAIEQETGHRLNPRVMFFQTLRQIAAGLPD